MPDEAVLRIITVDESSGQATVSGGSSGGSAPLGMPANLPPLPAPVSPRGHHGRPQTAPGSHSQSAGTRRAQRQAERSKAEADRLAKRAARDAERAASKATNEAKRRAAKSQREAEVAARKAKRDADKAVAATERDQAEQTRSVGDSIKKLTGFDTSKLQPMLDLFTRWRAKFSSGGSETPSPAAINARQPNPPTGPNVVRSPISNPSNVAPTSLPATPAASGPSTGEGPPPLPPVATAASAPVAGEGAAGAAAGIAARVAAIAVPLAIAAAVTTLAVAAVKTIGGAARATVNTATKAVNRDNMGVTEDVVNTGATALQFAGGPIGIVLGTIAKEGMKTIKALDELSQAFIARGKELSDYSPALAMAQARQEIRGLMDDLREARNNGRSYARVTDEYGRIQSAMNTSLLPIKKLISDELGKDLAAIRAVAEKLAPLLGEVLAVGTTTLADAVERSLSPQAQAVLGALRGIRDILAASNRNENVDDPVLAFLNQLDAPRRAGEPDRERDDIEDANGLMSIPII